MERFLFFCTNLTILNPTAANTYPDFSSGEVKRMAGLSEPISKETCFSKKNKTMKKILIIIITFLSLNTFAQKKPPPPAMVRTAGTSDILKTDKRLADFSIKKTKFNVYLGYQKPEEMIRQTKGDTLQVYKIALDKLKFSHLEITKYATRKGEIIGEGSYTLKDDTLTVTQKFYDYIGAYAITTKYITDKWGLKKVWDDMKGIPLDQLTERHLKPAEMKVPPPAIKQ